MLYPQHGDRIVTIVSVTSFHPIYSSAAVQTQVRELQFEVEFSSVQFMCCERAFRVRVTFGDTCPR